MTAPALVPYRQPQPDVSHAEMANAIRFLAIDAVENAKSGHPGMPMGMADVATVLFSRFLKFDACRSGVAGSRPVRVVGRSWLDAAVCVAASDRLCGRDDG